MPCGWGGNRRSGFALAMRNGLQWFIHLRAHGLRRGDEHPTYTPYGYCTPLRRLRSLHTPASLVRGPGRHPRGSFEIKSSAQRSAEHRVP